MSPIASLPGLIAAMALMLPASPPQAQTRIIRTPTEDGVRLQPVRAADQRRQLSERGLQLPFRLEDRLPESGIGFVHHIVDDAGADYKMVHYDHGNAVAAADVDGDGLPDLYWTSQLGPNELWRNLGDGRFENITETAGVAVADRISVGASFADADGDGDPDLYVTTVRQGNLFFENVGGGRFRDETASSGLGHVGHSSGSVWFDYDRDGKLDLFVTNVGSYTTDNVGRGGYFVGVEDAFSGHLYPERFERSLLFHNLGENRFEEVSEQLGLNDQGWSGDAVAADFDSDGWTDLYVLNMQGDDHLWLNHGGMVFVEATRQFFPKTPWGTMGVVTLDADSDGHFDLYLTDMHSDMSKQIEYPDERRKADMQWSDEHLQGGADNIFGNALYLARPGRAWEEVSDTAGVEVYWPWGVTAADFDADGREDLFVTASMNVPFHYQPNSLLWNVGGEFLDVAFPAGVEPRRDGRTQTPWFSVVCSGQADAPPFCRGRTGPHQVTATLGSRSSVALDVDGDGDLDLVTNEFNSPPQILINEWVSEQAPHWLSVRLRGSRSNRDGLGSRVTLKSGGTSLVRVHTGKSGYLGQSSLPLFFGLANASQVDEIVVDWPSGVRQVVPGPIAVDQQFEIVELLP